MMASDFAFGFEGWLAALERGSGTERTVRGPDGVKRFGTQGAAGLIVRVRAGAGDLFLIGERAYGVQHPFTWAVPGGAVNAGETAVEAALREAGEELAGLDVKRMTVVGEHTIVFPGGWTYTYVLADYHSPPFSVGCGWETAEARWVSWQTVWEMAAYGELHPDFADALPALDEVFGL